MVGVHTTHRQHTEPYACLRETRSDLTDQGGGETHAPYQPPLVSTADAPPHGSGAGRAHSLCLPVLVHPRRHSLRALTVSGTGSLDISLSDLRRLQSTSRTSCDVKMSPTWVGSWKWRGLVGPVMPSIRATVSAQADVPISTPPSSTALMSSLPRPTPRRLIPQLQPPGCPYFCRYRCPGSIALYNAFLTLARCSALDADSSRSPP